MNKLEAKQILSEQLNNLRKLSYEELCKFIGKEYIKLLEIVGNSGIKYQIEIKVF